jgi:hypothetical protein
MMRFVAFFFQIAKKLPEEEEEIFLRKFSQSTPTRPHTHHQRNANTKKIREQKRDTYE